MKTKNLNLKHLSAKNLWKHSLVLPVQKVELYCLVYFIYHYTSPGDIQIKIFDKAITLFNPGKLYDGLTIEQLKGDNYQSRIRNKLIAEAFYLTNDIEKYGSG